jgi:hypothetical protein
MKKAFLPPPSSTSFSSPFSTITTSDHHQQQHWPFMSKLFHERWRVVTCPWWRRRARWERGGGRRSGWRC